MKKTVQCTPSGGRGETPSSFRGEKGKRRRGIFMESRGRIKRKKRAEGEETLVYPRGGKKKKRLFASTLVNG